MHGPDDIVERVRNATSIVDVVGAHVKLRKRGRNYIGLCPFHSEKTPSFNVLEDKGIYKCFGCGEGGDVFSFVMKIDGLTFPEALEKLANDAGIEYKRSEQKPSDSGDRTEAITNACREYAAFCYRALRSEAGLGAMSYLRERRFSDETLRTFGVGYSPEGASSFIHEHEHSERSLGIYEEAGIILKGTSGDYYDRFHGRVIFPIYSPTGKIIGFGGRVMPSENSKQLAKYVNSPETAIYHKSQVLYGLFQAKDAIRKSDLAILVEGYADVLALHQAGFRNVVAASGTSLTIQQLTLLRRYTKQIVLLFDADSAGRNAALRGIELALTADFDVSLLILPGDHDPDSFIRENGAAAFAEELERRTSFIEAKARLLKDDGEFETPEGSARAVRSIVESIAKIPDAIKREFFVRRIAEKFRLLESTLLTELRKIRSDDETRERRYSEREQAQQAAKPQPAIRSSGLSTTATELPPEKAELVLLEAYIENAELAHLAAAEVDLDLDLITNERVRSIILVCIGAFETKGTSAPISELLGAFEDDQISRSMILDAAAHRVEISAEWSEQTATQESIRAEIRLAVHQSIAALVRRSLESRLMEVKRELTIATDEQQLRSLLQESMELSKKLEEARGIRSRALAG